MIAWRRHKTDAVMTFRGYLKELCLNTELNFIFMKVITTAKLI